jgi:IS30 family transposase
MLMASAEQCGTKCLKTVKERRLRRAKTFSDKGESLTETQNNEAFKRKLKKQLYVTSTEDNGMKFEKLQ